MKIIDVAKKEVGYYEKKSRENLDDKIMNVGSNNFTKYGEWYGLNGNPWCAMFISWCANQCGIPEDFFPVHASCAVGVAWFQKRGLWKTPKEYTPKEGDVIYFNDGKGNLAHVGLVSAVTKTVINTIEGNTNPTYNTVVENGGSVAQKSYKIDNVRIRGYGLPLYNELIEGEEMYNKIEEVPDWIRPQVQEWIDKKIIAGGDSGLGLTDEMIRTLVVCKRMIDEATIPSQYSL